MTSPITSPATSPWIHSFPGAPDAVADLVCLPHAGGSASFFHPLARLVAPRVRVLGVQYPGRQERRREPVRTDVREIAAEVLDALGPSGDRPTVYFGHSMGAVVAYEMALVRRPAALVVSGRRAPSRYRDEAVHRRDDAGVVAELRRLSGTHSALLADPEVLALILPALRGDYQAIETYRHAAAEPLECPVTVLTGDADPMVSADEAADWQRHAQRPIDLRVYAGGHFFLVDHAAAIAETLIRIAFPP
ncbi:MAG: thioesterase, partial [Streptomycetaceae bacterium]|nr:thioesterase [Streptomycetaceae bacterium]